MSLKPGGTITEFVKDLPNYQGIINDAVSANYLVENANPTLMWYISVDPHDSAEAPLVDEKVRNGPIGALIPTIIIDYK